MGQDHAEKEQRGHQRYPAEDVREAQRRVNAQVPQALEDAGDQEDERRDGQAELEVDPDRRRHRQLALDRLAVVPHRLEYRRAQLGAICSVARAHHGGVDPPDDRHARPYGGGAPLGLRHLRADCGHHADDRPAGEDGRRRRGAQVGRRALEPGDVEGEPGAEELAGGGQHEGPAHQEGRGDGHGLEGGEGPQVPDHGSQEEDRVDYEPAHLVRTHRAEGADL
mmetsp:Transcript_52339/g.147376  ORF Transcript_52339/g.147376 Transcript_52339/m.147376 type:complete len:223 (-) Transcript_52339:517-1185(-)